MHAMNKMTSPPQPNSREMRAYMQAILEATGLMAGEHFDISRFMRNYGTHIKSGKFIKHPDGTYSLSDAGKQYFIIRLTSEPAVKGQHVCRDEVIEMLRKITTDNPATGWATLAG